LGSEQDDENLLGGLHRRDAEDAEETRRVKTKKLPLGFLCELRDSAVRKYSFVILSALSKQPDDAWRASIC
jgi:hypothetical protein